MLTSWNGVDGASLLHLCPYMQRSAQGRCRHACVLTCTIYVRRNKSHKEAAMHSRIQTEHQREKTRRENTGCSVVLLIAKRLGLPLFNKPALRGIQPLHSAAYPAQRERRRTLISTVQARSRRRKEAQTRLRRRLMTCHQVSKNKHIIRSEGRKKKTR